MAKKKGSVGSFADLEKKVGKVKSEARKTAAKQMRAKTPGVARRKPAPKAAKPAPAPTPTDEPVKHTYDDRVAFQQAFADVRPLDAGPAKRGPSRAAAKQVQRAAEDAARARLDSLVAGGVSFRVSRVDGGVEGMRDGAQQRTVSLLAKGELPPEASLDLHGTVRSDVSTKVRNFVRSAHRDGRRTLAIVHGKGSHSEGGIGVLEDAVVKALTHGGAAPLVEAFATAPKRFGGSGALLVRLRNR